MKKTKKRAAKDPDSLRVVTLRLDRAMILALDIRALEEHRTVSNLIRSILERDMMAYAFKTK